MDSNRTEVKSNQTEANSNHGEVKEELGEMRTDIRELKKDVKGLYKQTMTPTSSSPRKDAHSRFCNLSPEPTGYCCQNRKPYPIRNKQDQSHVRQLCKIESTHRAELKRGEVQGLEEASFHAVPGTKVEGASQVMPGVLIRSENNPKIVSTSKVTTAGCEEKMSASNHQGQLAQPLTNGVQLTNGDNGLPNGTHPNGIPLDTPESPPRPPKGVENLLDGQLPPEIEHITYGYISFSSFISRLAQDTFNGLTELINDMSEGELARGDRRPSHPSGQINGNSDGEPLDSNAQKKLRMLEFVEHRRTQFVKALVLSQWSRQAEQVGKCIDLKVWLDTQRRTYNDAVGWVGELKRVVEHSKMPNPDLKTALEALSLGKASWLPDLNYLPPRRMTARDLLKALQRMNTLLSIRLNLHENIPLPFRDFSIASGRATFRVRDEFELDLSIAEEDPSSQLYFVDFRFLFSPGAPELPQSRLRDQLELKINDVLKRDGLAGCFDFLHDFVLTHKVSILRHQAFEMVRDHWSDHLKVEPVHRSLVVQYWIQRAGGKNWVELGIRKGKPKKTSVPASIPSVSQLALRWFRAGKEVVDVPVKLELKVLSMAGILNQIIAIHTTSILKETSARLKGGALYSERYLKIKQSPSTREAMDSILFLQLTPKRAVKVVQEPVTGRFAVLPRNRLNGRTERELNNSPNPATDAPQRIANLRCVAAQAEFDMHAANYGWEPVGSLKLDRETMQRFFPPDTARISFFRRKAWSPDWLLALTTSLMGDAVWIVQTMERKITAELPGMSFLSGRTIRVANKVLRNNTRSLVIDASFANLAHMERAAAGMISLYLNSRQLTMDGVPHRIGPPMSAAPELQSSSLQIYLPPSKASVAPNSLFPVNVPWRSDVVSLDYHGVDPPTSSSIHVAAARMQKAISDIRDLTFNLSSTIAFHPQAGAFAFRLTSPVGTTTIPLLLHRLSTIERLVQFLTIIRHHRLRCNIISLTRIGFTYSTNPNLNAIIDFAPDSMMRISLDSSSPHLRILDSLNSILRSPSGGLAQVLVYLEITSPLLRQLSAIEATCENEGNPVDILPRSAEWYELRYHKPKGRIDVLLRKRQDTVQWFIRNLPAPKDENKDTRLESGMKNLLSGKGEGWQGLRTGIAASVGGVEELLKKVDLVFRDTGLDTSSGDPENPQPDVPKPKEEKKLSPLNPRKRKAENDVVVLD